ncbi:MAG: alpha-galactosidase [Candidatus Izemoplasmataceae bacterium]
MIYFDESKQLFHLRMDKASYVIGIGPSKHLLQLHFGAKLDESINLADFDQSPFLELGSSTTYAKLDKPINLNITPLELATYGKGDYKEPTIHIETNDGYRSLDFIYSTYEIIEDLSFKDLPQARKKETLQITLKEVTYNIELKLNYTVYPKFNVVVRNIELFNHEKTPLTLDKMLSANFDFKSKEYSLITLDGAWIKERHQHERKLDYGIVKIDSKKGVSSSDHNPFFMLKHLDATKFAGDVYGFNLVYSGNFEANIEVSPHDLLRVNMGINSFDFKWALALGEHFVTPEAVAIYSPDGISGVQKNMHQFIEACISNNKQDRPILINNWEATYFDFNEKKLLALAKQAKKLGIEGFVLDDGWFGKRDDDTSSLGDWVEHPRKFKKGLAHFSNAIKKQGLLFGLWVEPEMVNPDSLLYRSHEDWAIKHPLIKPALGRNQLILDLSNPEVVDYLFHTLDTLFSKTNVDYVKWDMNRNFSDLYSNYLTQKHQGKLVHLYTLGLYQLLTRLKEKHPSILFESCASGGNRFDLGMHYYMPQAWTSDNTDAYERLKIQSGTYLGYPLSTVSNHVNADIAHQTIRHMPLETRFNVAAFGLLGYELDPKTLTPFSKKIIKKQIAFYKTHRHVLQYGTFYDLSKDENDIRFLVVDETKSKAIFGVFQGLTTPNPPFQSFKLTGLDDTKNYHVTMRKQYENLKRFGDLIKHAMPIKLDANKSVFNFLANRYLLEVEPFETYESGRNLMHKGLVLPHRLTGTGYHEKARLMLDFSSRLYLIEEVPYGNGE